MWNGADASAWNSTLCPAQFCLVRGGVTDSFFIGGQDDPNN
jgi:hypothetical protein